ncbi:MAG: hypothetical protein LBU04_07305 [Christensenellaceae bacterium]|nr:hypothetical protein [Christensenellaceae bacterium]
MASIKIESRGIKCCSKVNTLYISAIQIEATRNDKDISGWSKEFGSILLK